MNPIRYFSLFLWIRHFSCSRLTRFFTGIILLASVIHPPVVSAEETRYGYPLVDGVYVNMDGWLGWVQVERAPWAYCYSLEGWLYISASTSTDLQSSQGDWFFLRRKASSAPSSPTALAASNVTSTTFELSWNASTDDVGVAGYRVYLNGSNPVSTSVNSLTLTGLTPSTNYTVTVVAFDADGNISTASSALNVMTIATNSSFPTPSTTGPSGTLTPYSGELTTTSDGQLIENLNISGGIRVRHKNVTIRNCKFAALDIPTSTPTTGENCVVEDSQLGWAGRQNFTLRRCYMEVVSEDLIRIGGPNVIIEDSYLLIKGPRKDGAHSDIIQVFPVADYDNLVVNHNTLLNECNATSCINGPHMTITNNLMAGGSKVIYTSRSTITNNRFSTVYFPDVGSNGIFYGTNVDNVCSGNVIDETGAAVGCQ